MTTMLRYKLIVSDLDDTLLKDDLTISEFCVKTISKYTQHGGKFVIATGRNFLAVRKYYKLLKLDTFVICEQGAYVYAPGKKMTLIKKTIDKKTAIAVASLLEQEGAYFQIFQDEEIFVKQFNHFTHQYIDRCGVRIRETKIELSRFIQEGGVHVNKIMPECEDGQLEGLLNKLKARFDGVLEIAVSKNWIIEISPQKSTKKDAVQKVADYYGIKKEEILAIGDSYNDISMFEAAGLKVVVGNAVSELKTLADVCVADNNSSGVAQAIEKFAYMPQRIPNV